MTITRRVQRVDPAINTKRIAAIVTADLTKRVLTSGEVAAIAPSFAGDPWGGSWGSTWGNSWRIATPGTAAIPASPAVDVTARVSGQASGGETRRVPSFVHSLLLEGDESGYLLHEDGGTLLLEGDVARPAGNHTRRVTQ